MRNPQKVNAGSSERGNRKEEKSARNQLNQAAFWSCRQWEVQTCDGVRDLWSLTGLCNGVVDISSPCVEQKLRPFAHRSAWDGWMVRPHRLCPQPRIFLRH
jgi:hypothetical protein